jgi:hypothetical protein
MTKDIHAMPPFGELILKLHRERPHLLRQG